MLAKRLTRLFIGRRWRTFLGTAYADAADSIDTSLRVLEWEYTRKEEAPPTSGERVLFGSTDKVIFTVAEPNICIECASVSVDPLMKVFLRIGSRERTIDDFSNAVSLIDIRPITAQTHSRTATFIQTLQSELEDPPWDIHHPRFNYSPMLTYKVKLLWKYWLESTDG